MPTGVPNNGVKNFVTEKVKLKITVWAMANVEKLKACTAEEASILITKEHGVTLPGKAIRRIYDAVGITFHKARAKAKKAKKPYNMNSNRLKALARMVRDGFITAGIPFDAEKMARLCCGDSIKDMEQPAAKTPPV